MEIDLNELRSRTTAELNDLADRFHIEKSSNLTRQELIFGILNSPSARNAVSRGSGILEILPDGFGFLRALEASFLAGPDDIYVSPSQIRKFNLRTGDTVKGQVRAPKENERYFALIKVEHVNGRDPEQNVRPLLFDHLTATHPTRALTLEFDADDLGTRAVDLLAPIGKGQRVVVFAPPRSGYRELLRSMALGLRKNHPECHLLLLLLHQRPEDAVEFQRAFFGGRTSPGPGDRTEIVSTLFDEPAARHLQVADIVIERARRLAEYGHDVIVVLDSLTSLSRACNEAAATPAVRTLPGGLDPSVLQRTRRALASARALAEGGSITLLSTLMVDTDSHMDESVADLLRGTASAEIRLLPLPLQGVACPDPSRTFTVRSERFLDAGRVRALADLRGTLPDEGERGAWMLLERLTEHRTNAGLLDNGARTGE